MTVWFDAKSRRESSAGGSIRSRCVVVLEADRFNMVSNWRDAIVVSRPRPGALSVYARKYGESFGSPSRWRWETLDHTPELRSPRKLIDAIDRAAEFE